MSHQDDLRRAAEEALSSSLVHALASGENALVAEVAAWFDPRWMLDEFHRSIVRCCFRLAAAGVPVTPHSLAERLVNARRFYKLDMFTFCNWFTSCYGAPHLRYYAIAVHEHHRRNAISTEAGGVSHDLLLGIEDVEPSLEKLAGLTQKFPCAPEHRGRKNEDTIGALLRDMEGGVVPTLHTGLHALDTLVEGLEPGNVVVVGARPSCGKSALLGHIAAHSAARGIGSVIFSIEMSTKQLYQRWGCWFAECGKKDRRALIAGYARVDELIKSGLLHVFPGETTVAGIERQARGYMRNLPVRLVMVDYLQLVSPSHHTKDANRETQVSEVSRRLKLFAQATESTVIAASQLKREGSDKPTLSHLRESGAIEQDADVVLLLHPKEDKPISLLSVICAKQRQGETGVREISWHKKRFRFYDTSYREEVTP